MDPAEALRLLHKFSPPTKVTITSWSTCHLDNIHYAIRMHNNNAQRVSFDRSDDEIQLLRLAYPNFDSIEHGRVLVIPDAGSLTEPPFVCLASSLKQRLSETNIIGGRDTLLSFETSGVLVFFDHHDGVVTLHPQTN